MYTIYCLAIIYYCMQYMLLFNNNMTTYVAIIYAFILCHVFNYAVFSTCDQNVCENGGTCTQHLFEYKCDCPPSHFGSYCEYEIGECVVNHIPSLW